MVTNDGNVMPLFIIPHSRILNTEAYIKCLEEVVNPGAEGVAVGRPLRLETGLCTRTHKLKKSVLALRKFLRQHHLEHLATYSPDCNPIDYYVWGAVERETTKLVCNSKDELTARIAAAFTNLNKKTNRKFARDSEVVWRPLLKPMAITLDKFNKSYFKIF